MFRRHLVRLAGFAATAGVAGTLATLPAPASAAADPNKVLRWYFRTGESGFDPARISDIYSATVVEAIFERLLTYDYLARPAKLAPMGRRGAAAGHGRRPDGHDPAREGHPLRARRNAAYAE